MAYLKEHFKYIDKSKKILEINSMDSLEAALDGSQNQAFDYIVASNVMEYVPDMLKFFADVQKNLAESGKLYLTISNKAFSADCYRQPTTFAEIYDIHKKGVKNNPIRAFDYLLTVAPDNALLTDTTAFDLALHIYEQLQNSDEQAGVSLNVFTPESFLLILYSALKLRVFPFKVLFFSAPPEYPDFDVVLEMSESVLETEVANDEAEYVLTVLKNIKKSSLESNIYSNLKFEKPRMKYQKNKGLVSIIVPIYNTEIYLRECLDSILKQTFANWEAILVNDGSTDGCLAICKEYATRDSRFKIVHKENNEGLLLARKAGLENSSGEYIANLDSDDGYKPEFLEKMYAKIVETNADFVWSKVKYRDYNLSDDYQWNENIFKNVSMAFNPEGFKSYMWNKLVKREVYEKVKFPNSHVVYFEDTIQLMQIAFHSKNALQVPEYLYFYRDNLESSSKKLDEQHFANGVFINYICLKIFKMFSAETSPYTNSVINNCCYYGTMYYNEISQEARIKCGIEGIIYTEEFTRTGSPETFSSPSAPI